MKYKGKKIRTLGDFAKVQGGVAIKSKDFQAYGIPVIKIKNVGNGNIVSDNLAYVHEGLAQTYSDFYLKNEDIIISMTGSGPNQPSSAVGRVARYSGLNNRFIINQRVGRFIIKNDNLLNKRYLYYCLINKKIAKQLLSTATGSANQANISAKQIESLQIPVPELSEQKRIAHILGTLDDKIELNRQINQTLEAMAQAIFKSWFIDFDPVKSKIKALKTGKDPLRAAMGAISGKTDAQLDQLPRDQYDKLAHTASLFPDKLVPSPLGDIPEGWGICKISDFGNVVCGKTPPKSKAEYYGSDIPFIKIPDMHNNVFVTQPTEKLSLKGAESQKNKMLVPGTIAVSCIATVGKTVIIHESSQTNQQINSITPYSDEYTSYLYFQMLEHKSTFYDLASGGSATLNMNTSTFSKINILNPNAITLIHFDLITAPLFRSILNNQKVMDQLSFLRSNLLNSLFQ